MATLLHLPSELLSNILQSVTASSDATTQIRDLLSIAKTCSALHYAVFCDDILWRSPAIALGISPTTHLEDILYPGSSALAQRRWFNVVKLNYMWLQEFPDASATLPSKRKAVKFFPAESKNKGGKRTVEMCVAGLGAPPVFITAHAVSKLRGKALFNVIRANSGNLTGGVLDLSSATTATGAVVSKPPPREYCKLGQPGYVIERKDGVHTVCELDVEEPGRVLRRWNIGKRDISVFRARGDMLIALVCSEPPSGHVATKMVCMRAEGGDTEASILWECDISEDWKHGHQSEPFTQVHDFQLNRYAPPSRQAAG